MFQNRHSHVLSSHISLKEPPKKSSKNCICMVHSLREIYEKQNMTLQPVKEKKALFGPPTTVFSNKDKVCSSKCMSGASRQA